VRFVRVRLDGELPLHFRECQVFGVPRDSKIRAQWERVETIIEKRRNFVPLGRLGHVVEVGGFAVFVDDENYDRALVDALERGSYEDTERQLVGQLVTHTDRIIDVGTAIGVAAMTAARIAGPESVLTFDANAEILGDARDNFRRNGLEAIGAKVGILRNRRAIIDPRETVSFYIHKAFSASRLNAQLPDSNIVKSVQVPIYCLEDVIESHRATVLSCDIAGGEVDLLSGADLSRIRLIILKTHYLTVGEAATDEMVCQLILSGFALHLGLSTQGVLVLRRQKPN
jgi:FkbM family methyltransferase